MAPRYVPEAGDIVWLHFDPQAGHEQAGHRPAVVISPAAYNRLTGMMLCCPTTTRIKGYPFEVKLSGAPAAVALADQVKSMDWRARKARRKGRVSEAEMAEMRRGRADRLPARVARGASPRTARRARTPRGARPRRARHHDDLAAMPIRSSMRARRAEAGRPRRDRREAGPGHVRLVRAARARRARGRAER